MTEAIDGKIPISNHPLTFAMIQAVDFLPVIITEAQSLADDCLLVRRYYSRYSLVFTERVLAVVHYTVIVIRFTKARAKTPRVHLEIVSMFCKKKNSVLIRPFDRKFTSQPDFGNVHWTFLAFRCKDRR